MAILNLRSVPDPLMRELRAAAAMAGQPFHAFCVALLDQGVHICRAAPLVTVHPPIETIAPQPAARSSDLPMRPQSRLPRR